VVLVRGERCRLRGARDLPERVHARPYRGMWYQEARSLIGLRERSELHDWAEAGDVESLKAKLIKPEKKEDLDFNPVRPSHTSLPATLPPPSMTTHRMPPAPTARTVQRTYPITRTHRPLLAFRDSPVRRYGVALLRPACPSGAGCMHPCGTVRRTRHTVTG
jgi:hypothetical protein